MGGILGSLHGEAWVRLRHGSLRRRGINAEVPMFQTPSGSVWVQPPLPGPQVKSTVNPLLFCSMVFAFMEGKCFLKSLPKHSWEHRKS